MEFVLRLIIVFTFFYISLTEYDDYHFNQFHNETAAYPQNNLSSRQGKFWPFILPFYRRTIITKAPCNVGNLEGICMSRLQCQSSDGTPAGLCSHRKGVCCVVKKTCGESTNAAISYFINPEFPSPSTGSGMCQISITKYNDSICQLQMKFLQMVLAQPDADTRKCSVDFLSLGSPSAPVICGYNTDKTVYVDFDSNSESHQIFVDTSTTVTTQQRFWNVEIKQIPCDSSELAPSGCLMYYTSTSGSVSSFNFDEVATISQDTTNRLITDTNYGVCIKPAVGYCVIEWSQSDGEYTFTMSGDAMADRIPSVGEDCNHNYVIIPGATTMGIDDGTNRLYDRFCGTQFPMIQTKSQPYVLTVITSDDTLGEDVGTRGFKLDFRQLLC